MSKTITKDEIITRYGTYKPVYRDGYITGERINSVCMEAEALLTRLWLIADDYHIFPAKPIEVLTKAATRRMADSSLRMERVSELLQELEDAGLIARYEVEGETWGAFLQAPPLTHANGKGPRQGFPQPPVSYFAWDDYRRHWKLLSDGESKQSKNSRNSKESRKSKRSKESKKSKHNITYHNITNNNITHHTYMNDGMNGDDVCGLLVKLGLDQGVFKYLPLDCMDEDTVIRLWMSLESGLSNPQGMLVQRLKRKEVAEGQPKPQELWRACEGGYVQLIETPQKLIDCRNADVNFNNTGVNIGDDHIPVGEFENIMLRFSGGEG